MILLIIYLCIFLYVIFKSFLNSFKIKNFKTNFLYTSINIEFLPFYFNMYKINLLSLIFILTIFLISSFFMLDFSLIYCQDSEQETEKDISLDQWLNNSEKISTSINDDFDEIFIKNKLEINSLQKKLILGKLCPDKMEPDLEKKIIILNKNTVFIEKEFLNKLKNINPSTTLEDSENNILSSIDLRDNIKNLEFKNNSNLQLFYELALTLKNGENSQEIEAVKQGFRENMRSIRIFKDEYPWSTNSNGSFIDENGSKLNYSDSEIDLESESKANS